MSAATGCSTLEWTQEECLDSAWNHYGEKGERLELPMVERGQSTPANTRTEIDAAWEAKTQAEAYSERLLCEIAELHRKIPTLEADLDIIVQELVTGTHSDDVVVASFRETVAKLAGQLGRARQQRTESGRMFRTARDDRQKLQLTLGHLREVMISTAAHGAEFAARFDGSLKKAEKLTDKKWRENEEGKDKR